MCTPMAFLFAKNSFAMASLMIATFVVAAMSPALNSRPANNGTLMVEK